MSRVETIHIENRKKIKDIIIKFPELMESNAKDKIAEEYYNILSKEEELHTLRHKVWELEEEIRGTTTSEGANCLNNPRIYYVM